MSELSKAHHEQIEKLAYQLWEKRGRPFGSPNDDWLRAEQEFRQHSDAPPEPPLFSLVMEPVEH